MKLEEKPWRRFTLFCILFGYILTFGVKLSFWRTGLGFEDVIILGVGAWIVWLIVSDVTKFKPEEPRRRWWQRRHHHKSEQPPAEHEQT